MDIAAIETFLALANGRNMTEVSNNLYVSQSTISLRIHRLEEELGKKLVTRSKGVRGVTLTEEGIRFIPIAERWTAVLNDTKAFGRNVPKHKLLIGGTGTINSTLLSDFILRFIRENPYFSIGQSVSKSIQTIGMVESYLLDIGFTRERPADTKKNVTSRPAYKEKMYLACSAKTKYAKALIDTAKLIPENEIFMSWSQDTSLWRKRFWGPDVDRKISTVDLSLRLRLLEDSEYWTLCPASLVKMYSEHRGVKIFMLSDPPPDIVTYAVTRCTQNESLGDDVEYFLDQLKRFILDLECPGLTVE